VRLFDTGEDVARARAGTCSALITTTDAHPGLLPRMICPRSGHSGVVL